MNENDEHFVLLPENLEIVLDSFFKEFECDPRVYVPMDEAVTIWKNDFKVNEDGEYVFTFNEMNQYLDKINKIQIDRVSASLVKKGLVTLGHDGNDFVLMPAKHK